MKIKFEKSFIKTSLTLAIIAMVSGGLISLTYGITHDQIVKNIAVKKESAKKEIFKEFETETLKVTFKEDINQETDPKLKDTKFITEYSDAYLEDKKIGTVYFTSGNNDYGKISLMVGVYETDPDFKSPFEVIENTQSYADTLEYNFIIPYQNGKINSLTDEDVECGATYGASLIRDMILEAKSYHKSNMK